MNVTGDHFDPQSRGQSTDTNDNSTKEITQVLEDLKNRVVDNQNSDLDSFDELPGDDLLRRVADEEADGQNDSKSVDNESEDRHFDTKERYDNIGVKQKVFTTKVIEEEIHSLHIRSKPKHKIRTEKWGESVGIVDKRGRPKRVISLNELHNYLILKSWSLNTDSKIYCSLINERFPRFFDSTIEYYQRWRMRYNIFVDKVLADKSDNSLVHIGELHLYFDLIPFYKTPFFVNNWFYQNPNEAEKALDLDSLKLMKKAFESIRRSKQIFQLKFPVKYNLFQSTDYIFEKFKERHQEIMDESRAVNRKEMNRKFRENRPSIRGGMPRMNDFGKRGRNFPQNERQMRPNGRRGDRFEDTDQRMDSTEPQNIEFKEKGFVRNRGQRGRPFNRSFNNRKSFNSKQMNEPMGRRRVEDLNVDTDVMFEDTRERHERNGGKPQMEPFYDKRESYVRPKERPNRRSFNSQSVRHNMKGFNENHFSSNYTPATGALFSATDMENSRVTSVHSFGQPVGYGRYGSTNN